MAATLFVALVPPPEVTGALAERVAAVRAELPGLAWVDPARWHATVCFLGRAEPNTELERGLADVAARQLPLELGLDRAGHFGRRVLFMDVIGDLTSLAAQTAAAAVSAGYSVADRPFHPHLTVARGRGRGADLRPAVNALAASTRRAWLARELVLMSGDQPRYRRLASWAFADH